MGFYNMKHIETDSEEVLIEQRPLFASAWVALFSVLRKNYNERHFVDSENAESPQAIEKHQTGKKLN